MSEEETPAEAQDEPKGKKSKEKTDKKDKKDKKAKGKNAGGLTIAAHPRAGAQVRLAKGWGGVGAFLVTAYLSLAAGVTPDQAGLRAIAAGVGGYLLGWTCAVTIWRHLLIAELRALADHAHGKPAGPPPLAPAPPPVPEAPAEQTQPDD